jgi:hypothetical protein
MRVPAPPIPALHLPVARPAVPHPAAFQRSGRRPAPATVLLTVLYAAALALALTSPAEHVLAGCLVLGGLTARWAVRRRRSTAGVLAPATGAVDTALPEGSALPVGPGTAPAAAA